MTSCGAQIAKNHIESFTIEPNHKNDLQTVAENILTILSGS